VIEKGIGNEEVAISLIQAATSLNAKLMLAVAHYLEQENSKVAEVCFNLKYDRVPS
jgi:hypothetical protein